MNSPQLRLFLEYLLVSSRNVPTYYIYYIILQSIFGILISISGTYLHYIIVNSSQSICQGVYTRVLILT